MTREVGRPSIVLRCFALVLAVLAAFGCSSAATTYQPRPYRFEAAAPVPQQTQLVAQRMSARPGLRPVFVDPAGGTVLGPWSGPSSRATVDTIEGARAFFRVSRYRAFIRPNGWASSVFVDLEQLDCDEQGFRWTESQIFGNCRPVTNMTADQLRALDETGASLGG